MKPVSLSVITPVYKAEDYLKDTIESVLNQTYTDWEMILVDDQSPDRSADIIKDYAAKDKRIKLIQLQENSGAAVARNKGLEAAQGRYIAFIDADDVWLPHKLETQLKFMEENEEAFTYTQYQMVNDDGQVLKKVDKDLPKRLDYKGLLKNTAIACSTVVIDRQVIGDFRMPLKRKGQDTATWLMILRDHDYAYLVPEILGEYRLHEGSLSENKWKALARTWDTYRNYENIPLIPAAYYFTAYVFNAIKRRL